MGNRYTYGATTVAAGIAAGASADITIEFDSAFESEEEIFRAYFHAADVAIKGTPLLVEPGTSQATLQTLAPLDLVTLTFQTDRSKNQNIPLPASMLASTVKGPTSLSRSPWKFEKGTKLTVTIANGTATAIDCFLALRGNKVAA